MDYDLPRHPAAAPLLGSRCSVGVEAAPLPFRAAERKRGAHLQTVCQRADLRSATAAMSVRTLDVRTVLRGGPALAGRGRLTVATEVMPLRDLITRAVIAAHLQAPQSQPIAEVGD